MAQRNICQLPIDCVYWITNLLYINFFLRKVLPVLLRLILKGPSTLAAEMVGLHIVSAYIYFLDIQKFFIVTSFLNQIHHWSYNSEL